MENDSAANNNARICEIRSLYKKAEDAVSEISLLWDGLGVTPINQLRYAGRHLLDALTGNSDSPPEENFRRAENHCKRAIYDAMDSGIVYCLRKIDEFKNDYRSIEIIPIVPEYRNITGQYREAKALIDKARDHNIRADFYDEAVQHYKNLKDSVDSLDDAREELNKRLRQHNQKVRLMWVGVMISFLALAFSIWTYFDDKGAVEAVSSLKLEKYGVVRVSSMCITRLPSSAGYCSS